LYPGITSGRPASSYGGALRFVSGMEEPLGLRVVINGITHMLPNVIDPSELRSDVNGRLRRPGVGGRCLTFELCNFIQ
jgi:hypothetical protein